MGKYRHIPNLLCRIHLWLNCLITPQGTILWHRETLVVIFPTLSSYRLCWTTDHRAIKLKKIDFTSKLIDVSTFIEILKETIKPMGAVPLQKRCSPLHNLQRRKTKQSPDLFYLTSLKFFFIQEKTHGLQLQPLNLLQSNSTAKLMAAGDYSYIHLNQQMLISSSATDTHAMGVWTG